MFGAGAVRRKRERERKEKAARGLEPPVFPYIKPFGQRFERNKLAYFKYRQLQNAALWEVSVVFYSVNCLIDWFRHLELDVKQILSNNFLDSTKSTNSMGSKGSHPN